jgi:hypothetical protein
MPLPQITRKGASVLPRYRGRACNVSEIREMAHVLEVRHGLYAAEVARFFETANELGGDHERADCWSAVAHRIQLRQRLRQLDLD